MENDNLSDVVVSVDEDATVRSLRYGTFTRTIREHANSLLLMQKQIRSTEALEVVVVFYLPP
jgi:hypothetical protein